MALTEKKGSESKLEVPMSPMIDVVFLLLIYFLVTYEPEIPEAHLSVKLPGAPEEEEQQDEPPSLVELEVHPDAYVLRGKMLELKTITRSLTSIAESDPEVTVIIKVSAQSETRRLVHLLDVCKGVGLQNLNVVTIS